MKIFDGRPIPVFPLPSVILFPRIVQPLHIFEARYIEITFSRGIPVAVDGEKLSGTARVELMNEIAGQHGVGRGGE